MDPQQEDALDSPGMKPQAARNAAPPDSCHPLFKAAFPSPLSSLPFPREILVSPPRVSLLSKSLNFRSYSLSCVNRNSTMILNNVCGGFTPVEWESHEAFSVHAQESPRLPPMNVAAAARKEGVNNPL
jgi:hypothetical protein